MKEMEERHLRDLVTRAIPEVAAGIRRMVGDPDLADDLLQETLLTALVKLPELKAPFHLTAWLKVIARNKCFRALRGRRRMMSLENLPAWQELLGPPSAEEGADDLGRQLMLRLDRLTPILQDAIRMRYFQGVPVQQMAELLGIPQGTVKSRLHEARDRLRREQAPEPDASLYPDIVVHPASTRPDPSAVCRKKGYGLCMGAVGFGVGDVEVCDRYTYPGPVLDYRVRSRVARQLTLLGQAVLEVHNTYEKTASMENRYLYYRLDEKSIRMVLRIFQEEPDLRIQADPEELVEEEPLELRLGESGGVNVETVDLIVGDRIFPNTFYAVIQATDYHGSCCSEEFWSPEGRQVLARTYIGEDWRMGGGVGWVRLEGSPEIERSGRRYRLWNESVLCSPVDAAGRSMG